MKNTIFFLFLLTTILSVSGQEVAKPNIIIFYADDLGWQDTNLNNVNEPVLWETPNMEKLASAGAKFSQAYSPAPTCAPSRAAMLSGRNVIKTKVTQVSGGVIPALKKAKAHNKLIGPYYPERLDADEFTIAEALSDAGYVSTHVGKWHIAGANGFPEAIHQGFGSQFTSRGMHKNMGNRWEGYATDAEDDPYRIDEDGRPLDSVTEDAIAFMETNKSEPFFLYMATWLVHTPIQTRDLALLTYYCNKLGIPVPTEDTDITTGGQTNPYYGAMIGTLDWSLGRLIDYLEATDDPRNPGKKLFETTYIIFSSDNGASENDGDEIVADNAPLDLGKTSSKEGGIRVPLVITGPGIAVNQFSNVVNGLDFYPTILSLTGTSIDDALFNDLDGADLSPLLKGESTTVSQTKDGVTTERTDLFWHYPNADDEKAKSAIRSGDYKLYKKYIDGSYEAYQLYNGGDNFVDIEESVDVINTMPVDIKNRMIASLEAYLTDNNAKYPTWNPDYAEADGPLPNQDAVPSVTSVTFNQDTNVATAVIENTSGKAAIGTATLLYKENEQNEEWLESTETTINGNIITANVPESAIGIVFNMIDENNFLVLSEEVEILRIISISLNDTDSEQNFNPTDVLYETVGDIIVKDSYLQAINVNGGQGANFYVKSTNNTTIVCDKVTFGVRSRANDTSKFDVTIGGETQSFTYTSTKDSNDVEFDFLNPVSFTSTSQEIKFITTALTNSEAGVTPRFRLYDITFHVSEVLAVDDVKDNSIGLKAYPNPVKNTFSLTQEVQSGVLYNAFGAKKHAFYNQYKNIDISNLDAGLYLLQVRYKDGSVKHLKLLKE